MVQYEVSKTLIAGFDSLDGHQFWNLKMVNLNTITHKNGSSTTIVGDQHYGDVDFFVKVLIRKIKGEIIDYWPMDSFEFSSDIEQMSYLQECANNLDFLDDLCQDVEDGLRVVTAAIQMVDTSGCTPNGWEYDVEYEPIWLSVYKPSLSEAKELVRFFIQVEKDPVHYDPVHYYTQEEKVPDSREKHITQNKDGTYNAWDETGANTILENVSKHRALMAVELYAHTLKNHV